MTSSQPRTSQVGRRRDRRRMSPDGPVGDRRPLPAKRARLDSGTGCGWRNGNPKRNRFHRSMSMSVSMDELPGRQEQSRGSAAPKDWSDVAGGLVTAESAWMCAPSSKSRYTTYSKVRVYVAPATPAESAAGTAPDAQASWGTVCGRRALSSAAEDASRAVQARWPGSRATWDAEDVPDDGGAGSAVVASTRFQAAMPSATDYAKYCSPQRSISTRLPVHSPS